MKTFMVTGAGGFLGANVVLDLARRGHRVLALDLCRPPEALEAAAERCPGHVSWGKLDVTRGEEWNRWMDAGVDVLLHTAAGTPADERDPVRTVDVNLRGAVLALEGAARAGLDRVITLSSASVYREAPPGVPLDEDLPVRPLHGYGISKVAVESFTSLYRHQGRLDACSVRLSAIYGPWERPTGARKLMSPPFQLAVAAASGTPTRVSGAEASCDWTYVEDVARVLVQLAGLPEIPHQVINLSRGRTATVREAVEILRELCPDAPIELVGAGREHDLEVLPTRDGRPLEVERLHSLGLECGSSLREGLSTYVRWLNTAGHLELVNGK